MSAQAYELLSAAARYWFTFLGALILLLAAGAVYRSARGDLRRSSEERPLLTLRLLSDADKQLEVDYSVAVSEDGMVGKGRICDTRIKHKGLERKHAAFRSGRKRSIIIMPVGGAFVAVNGEQADKPTTVIPGDSIQLGTLVFRLETGGVDVEA